MVTEKLLRLRNDLYCVEWGVKLYSLTHSLTENYKTCTYKTEYKMKSRFIINTAGLRLEFSNDWLIY